MNLFYEEAIERIKKFAKIAERMNFEVTVGFSGGKDSQVVYDLCKRSGIKFVAYYNESFESNVTKQFIRENYPDVVWRRNVCGFFENISKNHGGYLPTMEAAFCCTDYKHNPKFVDDCSVVGIRRAESAQRKKRLPIELKNKTKLKENKHLVEEYFSDNCVGVGAASIIQLKPIIDWSDEDVWDYIKFRNLPINPEYKLFKRVGCLICPKARFKSNYITLMKYPKLIDCAIKARERGELKKDWIITSDGQDYSEDKLYYIYRWLNHSFRKFTKKEEKMYEILKKEYLKLHNQ